MQRLFGSAVLICYGAAGWAALAFGMVFVRAGSVIRRAQVLVIVLTAAAAACGPEKRAVGPSTPLTAPIRVDDPRAKLYETNAYQLSEGGRMFRWQGCGGCHTETSPGAARLTDGAWAYGGTTPQIYASIALGRPGMPGYAQRITPEQIWQIAGYLHGLPEISPGKRARQQADMQGEPEGARWNGPVR